MQGTRIAFGPFVLDTDNGTLLKEQIPITVGHRGLRLLAALTARPGEILTKAELMDAAWPGTAVEECGAAHSSGNGCFIAASPR
ncbi:hypothetical protein MesoLj131a_57530 [Mesorhizobium sp. 131-2-1]|nr:hypothetical protein MesoLj131a_57530 [Mesorhizobium sp. 131-2-1]